MKIVQAQPKDIDEILTIFDKAKQAMSNAGNPNQWINGYPSKSLILKDIEDKSLYLCVDNNKILGCFAFTIGDDPTYSKIYQGQWRNEQPYSVLHRIAISEPGKGVGSFCLNWCINRHNNIRVDTHEDNVTMQALLKKYDFNYCGIINNSRGEKRLAFQN